MNVASIRLVKSIHLWAIRLPAIAVVLTAVIPMASTYAAPKGENLPEKASSQGLALEFRSPLDGRLLTATEYAELKAEIDRLNEVPPQVSPKIRRLVGLLTFRKLIKQLLPIVPIK